MGTVRDVGTQFEIRLGETSLRVRVRTGRVEIRRQDQILPMRAGSETTVTAKGVETRAVPVFGPEWSWTAALAPHFSIEGRTLQTVLDDVAREEGWTLHFSTPSIAESAARIVLHGSVEGLSAEDTVAVALATSNLQYRLRDGELLVSGGARAQ